MANPRREYSEHELSTIERSIREGRGIAPALRDLKIPKSTFIDAMARDEALSARIDAAQAEAAAEVVKLGDIAAEEGRSTAWYQWKATRLCPAVWGDPAKRVEVTGAQGAPVQTITLTLAEAERLAAEDDEGE